MWHVTGYLSVVTYGYFPSVLLFIRVQGGPGTPKARPTRPTQTQGCRSRGYPELLLVVPALPKLYATMSTILLSHATRVLAAVRSIPAHRRFVPGTSFPSPRIPYAARHSSFPYSNRLRAENMHILSLEDPLGSRKSNSNL